MLITWDEPKRAANLQIHGFDFAGFQSDFDFETAVRFPTYASSTGRTRFAVIGRYRGMHVAIAVLSPLGSEALSLVSLRHASTKERSAHGF